MSQNENLAAVIETDKGQIRLRLFAEEVPFTVANFVNLARREFYNGLKFHRVIAEFMIQAGCPRGDGTGGPGYRFKDEFGEGLRHDKPGILSMANAGPNTNGSQFFITHVPTPWLDEKHAIFGEVTGDGDQEVVNRIEQGDKILTISIEGDVSTLMAKTQSSLNQWNRALDRDFPRLPKAPA